MFCKNCGMEISNGSTFCDSCGTKIELNSNVPLNQINANDFQSKMANSNDLIVKVKKKYPTKLVVGAIIAAILIIIIAIAAIGGEDSNGKPGGKSNGITIDSESIVENDLGFISNIEFDVLSIGINISGDFTASDYYSFDGMITESHSYAINFKAYDDDGKTLQSGTIYTPSVSAEETCSFLGNVAVLESTDVDRIKFTGISIFQ